METNKYIQAEIIKALNQPLIKIITAINKTAQKLKPIVIKNDDPNKPERKLKITNGK